MTSVKYIFSTILIALLNFNIACADDAHRKSLQATGKARVIAPISIVNTDAQGLDFGVIALGLAESKVVVAPQLSVPINVSSGDAVVLSSTPQTAAKFTVSGETAQSYSITLPTSATLTYSSNMLIVNSFTCSNGVSGHIGTNDLFFVGGELTIPAGATPGVYNGTFNVTVDYN